ncbi:klaroid protein-like isoform X1 [Periplaneta americana]|uniref:klaroid protein-like isoform X1 n=1 Tax=Periplaneta americana TaxID=6978 RepID=UPI0037E70006
MFNYGPTITNMKMEIDRLREEVDSFKRDFTMELISIRRDCDREILGLQSMVHKRVFEDISKNLLSMMDVTVKKKIDLYDADKIELPDFALEISGGSIVSTRDTQLFMEPISIARAPVSQSSHSARCVIQPCVLPGACWAFKGSSGAVVIKLFGKVYVAGFSLEHIPATLSPTKDIASAPRNFSVWGLNSLTRNGHYLGQYIYDSNGSRIQYFETQVKSPLSFRLIELKIHTNHGDPRYTCVYRFRVHGKLDNEE